MSTAARKARSARDTSPGHLTAFCALPAHDRRRVRALVYRRGYPLHKAMEVPPAWADSHLRYGYDYPRPWGALRTVLLVVAVVGCITALFLIIWRF